MKKLHLFNPENDLALARNLSHYTAPPAAAELARAGESLPLWYGADGDSFVTSGINAQWLRKMRDTFGIGLTPWNHEPAGFEASPWGWSKNVATRFASLGFRADQLPDSSTLDRIREISSRRSSCILSSGLAEAGLMPEEWCAEMINTAEEALDYCRRIGDALFKLPWSSSGRGQIRVHGAEDFHARKQAIEGALRRYGFITGEPFHRNKAADIALLFESGEDGRVRPAGLSLFETAPNGDYAGNVLAPDAAISEYLQRRFGIGDSLTRTSAVLTAALENLIAGSYRGPMGVDMMILDDGAVVGCVELNLRMTMGHVARRFHDRYCAPEMSGRFHIARTTESGIAPDIHNGRLRRGSLRLNPEGGPLAFIAELDSSAFGVEAGE